jgi:transcriptional regulator with XRE-family HTH domain
MEFSEKLQQFRKEKGITQEQLAEKLYVSRTAISKWESGRGYPSIESLRAISKLFSISIDDLLSGEELITIAEADNKEQARNMRDLLFGVFDCIVALLFFLPVFAQQESDMLRAVALLSLDAEAYIRIPFITFAALTTVFGIAELALQNFHSRMWLRSKTKVSLFLGAFGAMIFIVSPQPYAASFLLCLLVIKGILLIKQR